MKKKTIDFRNGKFFECAIALIDESMDRDFITVLTLSRDLVNEVAHKDFEVSKVMLMDELEKRLNEKYNPQGLSADWAIDENNDFIVQVVHDDLLTEMVKKIQQSELAKKIQQEGVAKTLQQELKKLQQEEVA